jgi:hypothetical protein
MFTSINHFVLLVHNSHYRKLVDLAPVDNLANQLGIVQSKDGMLEWAFSALDGDYNIFNI